MSNNNEFGLSVWQKIRLVHEWAPVFTFVQAYLATVDPHQKAIVVADCCEWLASKTETKVDDELVSHLSSVLRSKEGEAFLRWAVSRMQA
jgi:hypothetical protein